MQMKKTIYCDNEHKEKALSRPDADTSGTQKKKIILYSKHVYSTIITHYDATLELVTDPSHGLPPKSSSIGILHTPSREQASPDSKTKSSGMASKETATSEPTLGSSSATETGTLEGTFLSESLSSQTTASLRRRIKTQSSLTSTSATKKEKYHKNHAQEIEIKRTNIKLKEIMKQKIKVFTGHSPFILIAQNKHCVSASLPHI